MVNRRRMLNEFQTLASFDSESYFEKEIADYLFLRLTELGLQVIMDDAGHRLHENKKAAGNIYGYLKGNAPGAPILFSAHMDTVAPGVGKKVIVHEDGRVTSDGTTVLGADDITGIAAILEMLTVLKEEALPHSDIEVIFFIAEEAYCKGSSVFDFSKIKAKTAYTLDLDGRVGRIANEAPSILQFKAVIEGKSAHAGFEPEKGISAILVASYAISAIRWGRIDEKTTANIGTISGGTGKNIVPGEVVLEGEVRSLDHKAAVDYVEKIKKTFADAANANQAKLTFSYDEMVRAYQIPEHSAVIKRYKEALRELELGEPEIVTSFGGSDNNHFCRHGIEGIVISNAMNLVHTVDEYFYVDELVKNAEIVLRLATKKDRL